MYDSRSDNHHTTLPAIEIIERLVTLERNFSQVKEDLEEQRDTNRELIARLERLQECVSNAAKHFEIHKTYQKGIRNGIYTIGMIVLFFLAADFKEIGKIIYDFLKIQ